MAPTEDLIADRLGQWIGASRKDRNLLNQAVTLFGLLRTWTYPIWISASERKPALISAWKASQGFAMKTLTLDERDRQLRDKIAGGARVPRPELLVNTGNRRSQAKRELLAAIRQRSDAESRAPLFMANY